MITPQYTWLERVQLALAYERASDAFYRQKDDDPESTYWTRDDVEMLQCEIGQKLLREIPESDAEQMGGTGNGNPPRLGVAIIDFASGAAIEQAAVRIFSAQMQMAENGPLKPANGPVSIAEMVQRTAQPAASGEGWFAFYNGSVVHSGYRLRLTYAVEPELEDFQTDAVFLPATGYMELSRNFIHFMLTAADWLPLGRI